MTSREFRDLPTVFIVTLDEDYSKESVLRALDECEKELNAKYAKLLEPDEDECPDVFERRDEIEAMYYDIECFHDCYQEFDELLTPEEHRSYKILRMYDHGNPLEKRKYRYPF